MKVTFKDKESEIIVPRTFRSSGMFRPMRVAETGRRDLMRRPEAARR